MKLLSIIFFILGLIVPNSFYSHSHKAEPKKINSNVNNSNFTNLIVLTKFSDEDEFIDDKYGNENVRYIIDNMFNNSYYSLNKYYQCVSNNLVNINSIFLFDNGKSITLDRQRGYYAEYSETNIIGYKDSGEASARLYDLKEDWANAINKVLANQESLFDVDGYPISDYSILDKNNDGKIDAITIIYKKSPDTLSSNWGSPLWNYQDISSLVELTYDNNKIQSNSYFQITANFFDSAIYTDPDGYLISSPSTIIHEFGHIFGLKDLYRSDMSSAVYYMSAMAKHMSPIPQYISSKEREALNWLSSNQIQKITKNGSYTLNVVTNQNIDNVISYKVDLNNGKTAYLEYRNFNSKLNRFDNQRKILTKLDGTNSVGITAMKSGLVCYLIDSDKKFPNNLNTSGNKWNYQVLGGTYSTKVDAALGLNDEISLSYDVDVYVTDISEDKITFDISGIVETEDKNPVINDINITKYKETMTRNESFKFEAQINGENLDGSEVVEWSIKNNTSDKTFINSDGILTIGDDENSSSILVSAKATEDIVATYTVTLNIIHSLTHYDRKEPTCKDEGNLEYWYCDECNKYFLDSNHTTEVNYNDLILDKTNNHIEIVTPGLDSTCTKEGYTEQIECSICGKIIKESTVIFKKSHTIITIDGKEATCEEDGLTIGQKCSVCNKIIVPQVIIPKKGHTLSEWIIDKEATIDDEGHRHIECTICHKIIKEETIDKLIADNKDENNLDNDNKNELIVPIIIISSTSIITIASFIILFVLKCKKK